jgi:hypothetical protein
VVVKGELYRKVSQGFCKDVLHQKRDRLYYMIFMQEFAVNMPAVKP